MDTKDKPKYNNWSEGSKPEIVKLKRGEVKRFELLNLRKDPQNQGKVKAPHLVVVPLTDHVVDSEGNVVNIAPVYGIEGDGKPRILKIAFRSRNLGSITLYGNNPEDVVKYEYLQLSNYNAGNKNRDPYITPIFKEIIPKEDAINNLKLRAEKFKAESLVHKLSDAEVLKYFKSRGEAAVGDVETFRERLFVIALGDPKKFTEEYSDITRASRLIAGSALSSKLVMIDHQSKFLKLTETKDTLCSVVGSMTDDSITTELAVYLDSDEGAATKMHLQKELLKLGVITKSDLSNK